MTSNTKYGVLNFQKHSSSSTSKAPHLLCSHYVVHSVLSRSLRFITQFHSGLSSPFPAAVRAFVFIAARRIRHLLHSSSTRVEIKWNIITRFFFF